MPQEDAYRRLADSEIEHHKGELLYADRQALKRGEHQAVIARIRRRKHVSLCLMIVWCAAMVVLGDVLNRIAALVLLGIAVNEYVQARRTEEILRKLADELDARS